MLFDKAVGSNIRRRLPCHSGAYPTRGIALAVGICKRHGSSLMAGAGFRRDLRRPQDHRSRSWAMRMRKLTLGGGTLKYSASIAFTLAAAAFCLLALPSVLDAATSSSSTVANLSESHGGAFVPPFPLLEFLKGTQESLYVCSAFTTPPCGWCTLAFVCPCLCNAEAILCEQGCGTNFRCQSDCEFAYENCVFDCPCVSCY